MPEGFSLEKSEGYDWKHLLAAHEYFLIEVNDVPSLPEETFMLNPSTFPYLLGTYHFDTTEGLSSRLGLIETHDKNQPFQLYLTRSLSLDQWGKLVHLTQKHGVKLQIRVSDEGLLPSELKEHVTCEKELFLDSTPSPSLSSGGGALYHAKDRDQVIAQLKEEHQDENGHEPWVVDVSELSVSDILHTLEARYDNDTQKIIFLGHTSDIWQGLLEGKTVILTGQFSTELADHLFGLCRPNGAAFVNGKYTTHTGKLLLVAEEISPFKGLPCTVDDAGTRHQLIREKTKETFQALKLDPWKGLLHCDESNPLNIQETLNDEDYCIAVDQQRIQQVNDILKHSPYAFLAGKTGVGKSTFMEEVYSKNASLFREEAQLMDWIQSEKPGKKILFMDEANLGQSQWSRYEGLFEKPKHVFVRGKRYLLSDEHFVIFAGNPLSYGGERHLPPLFERHGSSCVFDALPPRYVAHRILRPLLLEIKNREVQEKALNTLMAVYGYVLSISKDKVLITPREMKTMAEKIAAYWTSRPSKEATDALIYDSAYQIAFNALPEGEKTAFKTWFETTFDQNVSALRSQFSVQCGHDFKLNGSARFKVTESRFEAYQSMHDLLTIRDFRKRTLSLEVSENDARLGGLGGIVFEGEPAAAKVSLP